ncbi:MAG: hypothetical protein HC875_02500, partial [Anaerolineales bacterium]|nr:hypothetical protein [Anaerolineales bacterium]
MNLRICHRLCISLIVLLGMVSLALPVLAHRPVLPGQQAAAPSAGTVPFTTELRSTGYIKGLYITYYGMGSEPHRTRAQELLETTELNAIVMDVKGDFGWLPYSSTVQTALDIGAGNRPMVRDWAAWMGWFKERNIYTIARIVVFKERRPGLRRTGVGAA